MTSQTKRITRIGSLRTAGLIAAGLRALEVKSSDPGTYAPIISDDSAEFLAGEVAVELAKQVEGEFPGIRQALISRQRFVSEWVTARIREGGRTVFSVSSGVDSRLSRLDAVSQFGARVVDIDSKPMLLLKLHRLGQLLGAAPPHTVFMESRIPYRLPMKTVQRLKGISARPAIFVLEGVLTVFDPRDVETLLHDIASVRVARRAIVMDFIEATEEGKALAKSGFIKAYAGGPPRFLMSREKMTGALEKLGFRNIHWRSLEEITGYYGPSLPEMRPVQVVTAEAVSGS